MQKKYTPGPGWIACPWAPLGTVFIAVRSGHPFLCVREATFKRLTRTDHDVVAAAAKVGADLPQLTVLELQLPHAGGDGSFTLLEGSPPGAPDGWREHVDQQLRLHARREARLAERDAEREATRRAVLAAKLGRFLENQMVDEVMAASALSSTSINGWSVRLHRNGDLPRAIVYNAGRGIAGRVDLPVGPLLVADEVQRVLVHRALTEAGFDVPGPPARELDSALPCVDGGIYWSRERQAWFVSAGDGDVWSGDRVLLGAYFPPERTLFTYLVDWSEPISRLLARHGFEVGTTLLEGPPPGYRADTAGELSNSLAGFVSRLRDGALPSRPINVRKRGVRRLTSSARELVPVSVAAVIEANWRHGYRGGPQQHAQSAPQPDTWTRKQQEALLEVTRPLPLPEWAERVWRTAVAMSPAHAPLLTAFGLHDGHTTWWDDLPVGPLDLFHAGSPWELADTAQAQPAALVTDPVGAIAGNDFGVAVAGERKLAGEDVNAALRRLLTEGDRDWQVVFPIPYVTRSIWKNDQIATCLHVAAQVIRQFGGPTDAEVSASRKCALCGTKFVVASLPAVVVLRVGSTRYCLTCCHEAASGVVADHKDDDMTEGVHAALRELAALFGGPPSRSQLQTLLGSSHDGEATHVSNDVDPARDRQMLLRMALPMDDLGSSNWGLEEARSRSWTEWLQTAGLLEDGWRPGFGTYSTATDGHPCRSMLERHIDDFFYAHGIEHEVEPYYPYHPQLNVTGFRADWRLGDGCFVEAAGLTSRPKYNEKLARKRALAAATGIELVVVSEPDLPRLAQVFARWLGTPRDACD